MAKKRYYQSTKSRLAESRGMERKLRGPVEERPEGYYNGYKDRKRLESMDSDMIREDHNAIANLPQNVVMKKYPRTDYYRYNLQDDLDMVDNQIDKDVRGGGGRRKAREKYPEKY